MEWIKRYRKFLVAAAVVLATGVRAAMTDGTITVDEWWAIGFAVAGALGVVTIPNDLKRAPGEVRPTRGTF